MGKNSFKILFHHGVIFIKSVRHVYFYLCILSFFHSRQFHKKRRSLNHLLVYAHYIFLIFSHPQNKITQFYGIPEEKTKRASWGYGVSRGYWWNNKWNWIAYLTILATYTYRYTIHGLIPDKSKHGLKKCGISCGDHKYICGIYNYF